MVPRHDAWQDPALPALDWGPIFRFGPQNSAARCLGVSTRVILTPVSHTHPVFVGYQVYAMAELISAESREEELHFAGSVSLEERVHFAREEHPHF